MRLIMRTNHLGAIAPWPPSISKDPPTIEVLASQWAARKAVDESGGGGGGGGLQGLFGGGVGLTPDMAASMIDSLLPDSNADSRAFEIAMASPGGMRDSRVLAAAGRLKARLEFVRRNYPGVNLVPEGASLPRRMTAQPPVVIAYRDGSFQYAPGFGPVALYGPKQVPSNRVGRAPKVNAYTALSNYAGFGNIGMGALRVEATRRLTGMNGASGVSGVGAVGPAPGANQYENQFLAQHPGTTLIPWGLDMGGAAPSSGGYATINPNTGEVKWLQPPVMGGDLLRSDPLKGYTSAQAMAADLAQWNPHVPRAQIDSFAQFAMGGQPAVLAALQAMGVDFERNVPTGGQVDPGTVVQFPWLPGVGSGATVTVGQGGQVTVTGGGGGNGAPAGSTGPGGGAQPAVSSGDSSTLYVIGGAALLLMALVMRR